MADFEAAEKVIRFLDRRGCFDARWEDIDRDTRQEIKEGLAELLAEAAGRREAEGGWVPQLGDRVVYTPAATENAIVPTSCLGTVSRSMLIVYVDWDDGHHGSHETSVLSPLPSPPPKPGAR